MEIEQLKEQCCGCGTCTQVCPKGALQMKADGRGFLHPEIDAAKCIRCGICDRKCPVLHPQQLSQETSFFACYHRDEEKHRASASGGLFTALAEDVIGQGGMVFGAAFDKNWNVEHCGVQTLSELGKLKGSKYAQSNMNTCFGQVKTALDDGKRVLFSGTPCQVQGLKSYLGSENDNLLCVDLICHGVASPKEWQRYLSEIAAGYSIRSILPRDKTNGITNAPIVIQLSNNSCIREPYEKSSFLQGFNRNLFLRPACFACHFKGIERCSDITIGDFWGVEAFYPEFASPLGVSVAMVHSPKGQVALDAVSQSLERIPCKADEVCKWNPCIVASTSVNEKSEKYYQQVARDGMKKTVERLTRKTLNQRCAQLKSKGIALIYPIYAKIKPLLRR